MMKNTLLLFCLVWVSFYTHDVRSACADYVTASTCRAATCFWDQFVPSGGACFSSIAKVNQLYDCTEWTPLGCAAHGCQLVNGTICVDYGTYPFDNEYDMTINYALEAEFIDYYIDEAAFSLFYTVKVPIQISLTNPAWPIHGTGYFLNIAGQYYRTPKPYCNTLRENIEDPVKPIPINSSVYSGTEAQLKTYFINWVETQHDYDWDMGTPEGRALMMMFGQMSVSFETILRSIDISVDGLYVLYRIGQPFHTWVNQCGTSYGVTVERLGSVTHYTIPVSYIQKSTGGGYSGTTYTFKASFLTSGSILSAGSVLYKQRTELIHAQINPSGCAVGEYRIKFFLIYFAEHEVEPNTFVGPVLDTDIATDNAWNCHEDLNLPFGGGCDANGICGTHITRQSHCRAPRIDGRTFYECAYGPQSMITNAATTGINMNAGTQHDFFVKSRRCPNGSVAPGPNFMKDCVVVSTDTLRGRTASENSPGDRVRLNIRLMGAYPTKLMDAPIIDIRFGLLPDPKILAVSDYASNTLTKPGMFNVSSGYNSNNQGPIYTPIPADGLVTFAVWVDLVVLRSVYSLDLLNGTGSIKFYFIQSKNLTVQEIKSSPSLDFYTDLKQYSVYNPRRMFAMGTPLNECGSGGCLGFATPLPACLGSNGCDGVSIMARDIQAVGKAKGLAVTQSIAIGIDWTFRLPGDAPFEPIDNGLGRRLLSVANETEGESEFAGSSLTFFTLTEVNTEVIIIQAPDPGWWDSWDAGRQSAFVIGILLTAAGVVYCSVYYRCDRKRYQRVGVGR